MTFYLFFAAGVSAGEPLWAWMRGGTDANVAGIYGSLGVPALANYPGARHGAATWTGKDGRFWLFGGYGVSTFGSDSWQYLNDLWSFNPATGLWTWVKGSSGDNQPGVYGTQGTPAPPNTPGARTGDARWTDSSGRLWLFGGYGYDSAGSLEWLNDLWMFNPATTQWMWVKGSLTGGETQGVYGTQGTPAPANTPGARQEACFWTGKDGRLWLFGGFHTVQYIYRMGDLWSLDPATGNWTWVKGSNGMDTTLSFGAQGEEAATNSPGGRAGAAAWTGKDGRLWMLGGWGNRGRYDGNSFDLRGDLWRYNPTTNNWTWIKGYKELLRAGVYGTQGKAAAANMPGARWSAAAWTDGAGRLWLFGGLGLGVDYNPTSPPVGILNDLWCYEPVSGNWTWQKGGNKLGQVGYYGTLGVAGAANTPGSRIGIASWVDAFGRFWFLGGTGYSTSPDVANDFNDLWRLTLPNAVDGPAWRLLE